MSPRLRRRAGTGHDDRGVAALELSLGAGALLLPVAVLVLSLPTWIEHTSAARLAAAEAGRVLASAADWPSGASEAQARAQQILDNHGVGGAEVVLTGALARGGVVEVGVTVRLPALPLPGGPVPGFSWTTRHREAVDRYRSLP